MPELKTLDQLIKGGFIKMGDDPSLLIKYMPTGIPQLDELMGGGVPIGRCLEIYGPESTGKTLIAQFVVSAVQKTAKPSALYLDLEGSYDKEWWQQSGVDTSKLLVSNPATAEQAIDIMVAMLESMEDLGIIILDSIAGMVPAIIEDPEKSSEDKTIGALARLVTLMYSKLKHTLLEKEVILLATNQMRSNIGSFDELQALPGGKAQRHYNQIILRTHREGWIKENNQNVGFYMEIISKKNKTCGTPDGTSITLPCLAAGQIDLLTAFLSDGISKKLIEKHGPYYVYNEQKKLGMANLRQYFTDNPEELALLKRELDALPA